MGNFDLIAGRNPRSYEVGEESELEIEFIGTDSYGTGDAGIGQNVKYGFNLDTPVNSSEYDEEELAELVRTAPVRQETRELRDGWEELLEEGSETEGSGGLVPRDPVMTKTGYSLTSEYDWSMTLPGIEGSREKFATVLEAYVSEVDRAVSGLENAHLDYDETEEPEVHGIPSEDVE